MRKQTGKRPAVPPEFSCRLAWSRESTVESTQAPPQRSAVHPLTLALRRARKLKRSVCWRASAEHQRYAGALDAGSDLLRPVLMRTAGHNLARTRQRHEAGGSRRHAHPAQPRLPRHDWSHRAPSPPVLGCPPNAAGFPGRRRREPLISACPIQANAGQSSHRRGSLLRTPIRRARGKDGDIGEVPGAEHCPKPRGHRV